MKTHHCQLCENKTHDLSRGIVCGLTQRKPDFITRCNTICFGETLKQQLISVNKNYQAIEKRRILTWVVIWVFFLGAIAAFYFSSWLFTYFENKMFQNQEQAAHAVIVPYFFIAIGIALFLLATAYFNRFRLDYNSAKIQKQRIDSVLKTYGVMYEIEFHITEHVWGLFPDQAILSHFKVWQNLKN